jgi:pimeloyl-ACP methyl ester carboxylesterase
VKKLLIGLVVLTALAACTPFGSGPPPTPVTAATGPPADDPATNPALAAFYGQRPTWVDCGNDFSCASVQVPLDWADPAGQTIKLAMIRKAATGARRGSLFMNPGGPGVSGVGYLRLAASTYDALRVGFDLVSWDPRGVRSSSATQCLPDSALDAFFALDGTPDSADEQLQLVAESKDYAQSCKQGSGALLQHVDTISTAKDMDVLRAVVGDPAFSYFGASYGTYLGAWYAQLFPWRVGRMVLDGAVDPSLDSQQYTEGQAKGFALETAKYLDNCLGRNGCPLRGARAEAVVQLQQLANVVDGAPLRTTGGRQLTQALFMTGLMYALYSPSRWPQLGEALTAALAGDGTAMLALADRYLERDRAGHYGATLQQYGPIYCLDHGETRTTEQIAAEADRLQQKYPPFGGLFGWGAAQCAVWPYPQVVPAQRLTAPGSATIVVVGTTDDPATPYEWAESLASQLSNARLVTRQGDGHTGYHRGSACTDEAVEKYLLDGVAPASDVTCS